MIIFLSTKKMERLLCIGLLLTLVSFSRGTITQAPQDEVYHRGTDTNGYVTCIVSTPVESSVFWSVHYSSSDNDNGIIYTDALGIFENVKNKFSVNADALTSGNFTLVIKDLDRDDTGSYTCQHGQDPAITAIITVAGMLPINFSSSLSHVNHYLCLPISVPPSSIAG